MGPGPSVPQASQGGGAAALAQDAATLGIYAIAAVLVVLGLWLLWGGRADEAISRQTSGKVRMKWWLGRAGRRVTTWSQSLTTPTRLTFAMSLLMLGYHIAAWTAPSHVLPFHIPTDLWFLLVGGAVVGCGMSLWLDRRQADDDADVSDAHGGDA